MTPSSTDGFSHALGAIGIQLIRAWLRISGRSVHREEAPWLWGPVGPPDRIGDQLPRLIAEQEGLELDPVGGDAGLMPDFFVLGGPDFDPAGIHPEVRRFYERTTDYDFDVWNHAPVTSRLILWLIVRTISRRMDQLNFPVTGLEMSLGMNSNVLCLRRKG